MVRRLDGPAEVRVIRFEMTAPHELTSEMRRHVEEMVLRLHAAHAEHAAGERREVIRIVERKEI